MQWWIIIAQNPKTLMIILIASEFIALIELIAFQDIISILGLI